MNATNAKPAGESALEEIGAILELARRCADTIQIEPETDRGVRALQALKEARQVLEKGVSP